MATIRVKKKYKVGDNVWIYGVATGPGYNRLTEGTVIHIADIEGYSDTQYVISIPNGIEDLLEVRSWSGISQDDKGPVGAFRELIMNRPAEQKMLLRTGLRLPQVELNPDLVEDQDVPETDPDQD